MADQVRRKEVSPVELAEAHLEKISSLNPKLNAFVQVVPERVREAARDAEAAVMAGHPLGRVHGVPLSIKSSVQVSGMKCESGTRLRAGTIAVQDAPLVARLREAGAVILGVTNTPEFLMAWETDNLLYGRTNNPWNLERTAGGSSGGESAAVSSAMSAGGVGSDGGGSIRVPAHFCGICGLKPTPGRIPATGHFPPSGGPFSWIGVVGPMARSVADLRLLFSVMAGPDPGDPMSAPVSILEVPTAQLLHTRIGLLEGDALGNPTDETRGAVESAAKLLQSAGFVVEPVRLSGLDRALELWWFFFGVVIAHLLGSTVAGKESLLSPQLKEYLGIATNESALSLDRFIQACAARDALRESLIREMSATPILLSPVSTGPAFRHGNGNYGPGTGYLDTMR